MGIGWESPETPNIGIDKPYGGLVQRSYDFDYSTIPANRIV
jgi:hypothetical protein